MRLLVRSCVAALMLVSAFAFAGPLDKPKAPEARAHLEKGNKVYGVRDFEKAIEEYKAGALVENTPIFDYNLGQCYRQLGRYEDAIWHYERFIKRAQPTGELLDAVNRFIEQMKAELEKRAKTQQPTEAAPATGSASTTNITTGTSATNTSTSLTTSSVPPSRSPDWFGIGLVSAGSVGVVVGGVFLYDASSLRDEANATSDQRQREALFDKADTRSLVGWIAGGVGVAVLGTGVIKLVVGRSSNSNTSSAWNVGASQNSLYVFGRF